jgi:hypothetical protein
MTARWLSQLEEARVSWGKTDVDEAASSVGAGCMHKGVFLLGIIYYGKKTGIRTLRLTDVNIFVMIKDVSALGRLNMSIVKDV